MTKIKLTNPLSLTQQALHAFGTYEEIAKATRVSISTIKQWRAKDKVPNAHLSILATKAGLSPIALYQYCKDKSFNISKVKQRGVVDALISGEVHPDLDDIRRKQLLTLWGDKLPKLREIFEKLTLTYEDQEDYGLAVRESASDLGVTRPHIYRLMRLFSVKRKPFRVTKQRENQSKESRKRLNEYKIAAISAVKGQKSVTKLAKDLELSQRQMFRYVEDALRSHPGLNMTVLTRYPKYFRMAVANEIENNDHKGVALKLKAVYDEFPPVKGYRAPGDMRHASFKDKLIAVLTAEYSLNDMSVIADTPVHVLEEGFNRYCVPFELSWQTLRSQSLYHQAFFAEILKGSSHAI
jgi:hypothetical protein